jgi:hypothetical protein
MRDLERMLGETLVPVDPSPQFLQRLRARLVTLVQPGPSLWLLAAGAATLALLAGATFTLVIRVLLIVGGLLTLSRRRSSSR